MSKEPWEKGYWEKFYGPNVRPLPRHTARALKAMLVEHEVATTILEAEAKFGPLSHVDMFADEIRRERRRWRPPPSFTDRPFGCPLDEGNGATG